MKMTKTRATNILKEVSVIRNQVQFFSAENISDYIRISSGIVVHQVIFLFSDNIKSLKPLEKLKFKIF